MKLVEEGAETLYSSLPGLREAFKDQGYDLDKLCAKHDLKIELGYKAPPKEAEKQK